MDLVISVSSLPLIGESKNGHGFLSNQGGKGANQAVACKKLGATDVRLIASVGNDENGTALLNSMNKYGINTDCVKISDQYPSGVCMIILDESVKDNMLIVDAGANNHVNPEDFSEYLKLNASFGDIFITQLEVASLAVYEGLKIAKEIGLFTILNPAPVKEFDRNYLKYVDLIIPNETEVLQLTNIKIVDDDDLLEVYNYFKSYGVNELIVTLGSKGSAYLKDNQLIKCPAQKVNAVDTTSAGDTFIGALAMRLAKGYQISDSLEFASKCSAITVSRKGAASSIPTADEVKHFD